MCGLRKAGLALLLALPTTEVLAESLVSCAAGSCPGQPSTQAPSMVQTKMQRRLALVGGAGDLAGAVTRLAVSGRDGKDLELQLQEASALVSAFKSLAAAGNGTNGTLKGVDKTQLAAIKDLINKTFFANLQNLSAEDQAEVTSDHAFLVQCGTPLRSSLSNDVANALAKLNASRTSHKHCRTAEAAAFMANTTAWSQYSALVQSIPPPPACPTYTQTLDAMEDYFDSAQNTQKKWYEDNAPVFAAKKTTYNNADQTLQSERTRCNGLQSTVEQDYCFYQVKLQTTCTTYKTCHRTNLGKYTATTARVRQSEATRKSLFKSGTAIICHLDVILTGSKVHDDCTSEVSSVDTSSLDISYPAAPSKSTCDTTTVSAFPCDAGWIAAEYSWMPQGAAAAACSKCPSQTPAPTPQPTPQPTPAPTPTYSWGEPYEKFSGSCCGTRYVWPNHHANICDLELSQEECDAYAAAQPGSGQTTARTMNGDGVPGKCVYWNGEYRYNTANTPKPCDYKSGTKCICRPAKATPQPTPAPTPQPTPQPTPALYHPPASGCPFTYKGNQYACTYQCKVDGIYVRSSDCAKGGAQADGSDFIGATHGKNCNAANMVSHNTAENNPWYCGWKCGTRFINFYSGGGLCKCIPDDQPCSEDKIFDSGEETYIFELAQA